MKKLVHTILCLMVGISIETHATSIETSYKVYGGKFDTSQVEFYDNMIKNVDTIEIYDTSELTHEIMMNRSGKIIVEKIIGEVVNDSLDGRILNCDTDNEGYTNKDGGNYINYERVECAKKGDKVLTYYIYSPFSNE